MHLRRALLLFALVLGLSALAASIAPAPRDSDEDGAPQVAPPPSAEPVASALTLEFQAPAGKRGPPVRRVDLGRQLIVKVASEEAGEAQIPRLGRIESLSQYAGARFDLVLSETGRYDVLFTPVSGEPQRVGTIVAKAES